MFKKKIILVLLLLTSLYGVWWLLAPVKIIGVHHGLAHNYILVKNFPITDQKKISWWKKNNQEIKQKYKIPTPNPSNKFTIVIWDIGSGYKEMPETDQNSDLLCFTDINKKNCVEKPGLLMKIYRLPYQSKIFYEMNDGSLYDQLTETSELKRIK
ncbi:DUF943 family protein [Chimaeribacter arupi]|uniref:DUF943 domain-containing protein n=1 Tax=Chimaeribacter arupi TaxID=2060066 RepID=A0A2N5EHE6_9GAMM|nr:DUF943 family protein [Chimaeribacter arupi]PLR43339.1 hypothetical protein CYR34_20860 [Chimaeribacter arupi]WKZ91643.1 DUF943 family protein [Chimaeribacter arupi]